MWVDHQEATVSYGGGNRGYVVGIRYQFVKYNFLILRSEAPLETSFQDFKKKTPEKKKKTLFQASALCKSVLKPSSWIHPSCPTLHQWDHRDDEGPKVVPNSPQVMVGSRGSKNDFLW